MSDKKKESAPESAQPSEGLAMDSTKTCFVMMPIADVAGYAPGHFDRVYQYIIEPACLAAGFKPKRADQVKAANVIMMDILERILNADMVVCDISSRNPNVLYELGIRQAFDKPVTLLKDFSTADIFDVNTIRYVSYDHQLRIDLVDEAVKKLSEAITETYDNRDKGLYSLVQLLGWQKAELKTSQLSDDTKVILEAINELRSKSNSSNSANNVIPSSQPKSYVYRFTFPLLPTVEEIDTKIRILKTYLGFYARNVTYFNQEDQTVISMISDNTFSINDQQLIKHVSGGTFTYTPID